MSLNADYRPWYGVGLGLNQKLPLLYRMLRHLPGRQGVDPYVSWISHVREARKDRTTAEFERIIATLDERSLVLDCGANVGDVTARLAETGARVHSFEPEPFLFSRLQERFSRTPNVTLHNVALASQAGTASLWLDADESRDPLTWQGHSILDGWLKTSGGRHVQVTCIDFFEFIDSLGRKPDLIKMDIEGAELEILERLLDEDRLRDVTPIFVETHERQIAALRQRYVKLFRDVAARGGTGVNLLWP